MSVTPLRRRGAENEIDPAAGLRPAVVEVMKAKSKDVYSCPFVFRFDLHGLDIRPKAGPGRFAVCTLHFSASLRLCGGAGTYFNGGRDEAMD